MKFLAQKRDSILAPIISFDKGLIVQVLYISLILTKHIVRARIHFGSLLPFFSGPHQFDRRICTCDLDQFQHRITRRTMYLLE